GTQFPFGRTLGSHRHRTRLGIRIGRHLRLDVSCLFRSGNDVACGDDRLVFSGAAEQPQLERLGPRPSLSGWSAYRLDSECSAGAAARIRARWLGESLWLAALVACCLLRHTGQSVDCILLALL